MAQYARIESGSIKEIITTDHIEFYSGDLVPLDFGFVKGDNFDGINFSKPDLTQEQKARKWRDQELENTDWIVPLTDHPDRSSYMTYRTDLRNWPTTADFPNTIPTRS